MNPRPLFKVEPERLIALPDMASEIVRLTARNEVLEADLAMVQEHRQFEGDRYEARLQDLRHERNDLLDEFKRLVESHPNAEQCDHCNGRGEIAVRELTAGGYTDIDQPCIAGIDPCDECRGIGKVVR